MEQRSVVNAEPSQREMDLSQPDFHIDFSVQQREGLDPAIVEEYAELYREGRDLGPIVVFADKAAGCFLLADGFHRCQAARQAGRRTLPAEVHQGGRREAILFATSCNRHGLPRSNTDKRKAVTTLLADAEWQRWSDNHIAKHTGVSQPFVSQLRKSLLTVRSEQGDTAPRAPTTRRYVNKHG